VSLTGRMMVVLRVDVRRHELAIRGWVGSKRSCYNVTFALVQC
jgi:hypothetical protein